MAQLDLINADADPWGLALTIRSDPTQPEHPTSCEVVVLNGSSSAIHTWRGRFIGIMPEYLPTLAADAVMAYLYGDGGRAITEACRQVRRAAVDGQQAYLARYFR